MIATVGDINIPRPWFFDFKARAVWNAWNAKKGMSSEQAKKAFALKVEEVAKRMDLITNYR